MPDQRTFTKILCIAEPLGYVEIFFGDADRRACLSLTWDADGLRQMADLRDTLNRFLAKTEAGVVPATVPQPCLCPNGHGQMARHDGPLAPGASRGPSWKCATCGIERMWPDAGWVPAPAPQEELEHTKDAKGHCVNACYACERRGLQERIKFTADYESLKARVDDAEYALARVVNERESLLAEYGEDEARALKAEDELAAIKAGRERIHAQFRNVSLDADSKCQCPYCRRDAEELAELAADYEMHYFSENQRRVAAESRAAVAEDALARLTWQSMDTAPKDGTKIDIWAKIWVPQTDSFQYRRFADCYWWKGDGMNNKPAWMNLHKDWHAVRWMVVHDGPQL